MLIDIPVRRLARTFGMDVERKRPTLMDLLQHHRVDTVLDVGANVGQFATRLRSWGFRGRIVSFEPLAEAHAALAGRARHDERWEAMQLALGAREGTAELQVSPATVFSSIRRPTSTLRSAFDTSAPERTERIEVKPLDAILPTLCAPDERVFLKVDTQGFEREVLDGAKRSLSRLVGVQVELSLTPMYDGEAGFAELLQRLQDAGFTPVLMEPVAYHPDTRALLQVDCALLRSDLLEKPMEL